MHDTHRAAVAGFYETHPINEDEILQKLSGRGLDLGRLTEQELKDFDQDHYGGVEAVEALAEAAGISRGQHVLDVGSGMGGPARWLAHKFGCHVTGLDLTDSRVLGARRLTERVGLSGLVEFVQGDTHTNTIEGFFGNLKTGMRGDLQAGLAQVVAVLPGRVRLPLLASQRCASDVQRAS